MNTKKDNFHRKSERKNKHNDADDKQNQNQEDKHYYGSIKY